MESPHTVKDRICNESARINAFTIKLTQGFAIPTTKARDGYITALKLVRVITFDISPMVLIKVGETIIEKYRRLEVGWDVKQDCALVLARGCNASEIGK
jgi:hypothetical protein